MERKIKIFARYYNAIKVFLKAQIWAFKNRNNSLPIYTRKSKKGLMVHLGSGPINIQGWVNVDARKYDHTHLESDGFNLNEFSDGGIDEIYMCHVLEHFSFDEAENLLKKIIIKLNGNGVIRVSVPSFDSLLEIYRESDYDVNSIKWALFGGQDYEFNFHKSFYNKKSLINLLEKCGFKNIRHWDTIEDFGVSLDDWSNSKIKIKAKSYYLSLNLKGHK